MISIQNYNQYPVSPWKNGGGTTREIYRQDDSDGVFLWRLSLADVGQSGVFSDFAGYDRIITLLAGEGFSLNFLNCSKKELNQLYQPYAFDGGASLDCQLFGGASSDLNLMTRRGQVEVSYDVLDISSDTHINLSARRTHLLFCLAGGVELVDPMQQRVTLDKWATVKIDLTGNENWTINPSGQASVFHIQLSI